MLRPFFKLLFALTALGVVSGAAFAEECSGSITDEECSANAHSRSGGPPCRPRIVCKLGLEGIVVSKRKDSAYRSGRSPDWLKMKNVDAPAVKREAEEDWGADQ
jgi:hypothetical protein